MNCLRTAALCLALALLLPAAEPDAADLYKQGKLAERKGDIVRAYLLYSEAAAKAPDRIEYWARAQALRTEASLRARVMPRFDSRPDGEAEGPLLGALSEQDLADLQRLKPPPDLQAMPGRKTLDLRGDAKNIFEQIAKAFGLDTVFDGDFQPGQPLHLDLGEVDFRQALNQAQLATGSFIVPLGERLFLVAKDVQQKRTELEPVIAVTVPIPDPTTPQEAQELLQSVQQTMELQKCIVDNTRRQIFMRDRISKVRPAMAILDELAHGKAQVAIEVQFIEVDRNSLFTYGMLLPNTFNISWLAGGGTTSTVVNLAKFLFGHQLLAMGIADASAFATMTKSSANALYDGEMRALDGSAATFHVGDKYPIETAGFLGTSDTGGIAPSFNFEDLGLVLKVTPHVHGLDEVSLDVVAEMKLLAGSSVNDIPVVSNRKIESKVRLKTGQWALIAGLMNSKEARSITGVAGLMNLPVAGHLFRKTERTGSSSDVVLVLKPSLISLPPSEYSTGRAFSVGTEGHLRIPL